MDKVSKKPSFLPGGLFGKRKSDTLQDKIDAAQKRQARARAEATLEPVTVSPAPSMTKAYTTVGMVFRALDGQLYLTLHSPNAHLQERPRFFPLEEKEGRLIRKEALK